MAEPVRISPQEAKRRMDEGEPVLFIDTRNRQAWSESDRKIPGAIRIHYSDLERHLDELPDNRPIVTYCT